MNLFKYNKKNSFHVYTYHLSVFPSKYVYKLLKNFTKKKNLPYKQVITINTGHMCSAHVYLIKVSYFMLFLS